MSDEREHEEDLEHREHEEHEEHEEHLEHDHGHEGHHEHEAQDDRRSPGHDERGLAADHEHEGLSTGRDPAPHLDAPHFGEPPGAQPLTEIILTPPARASKPPAPPPAPVLPPVELTIDGVVYLLKTGDSFAFKSTLKHSFRNRGKEPCEIVWINMTKPEIRNGS